MESFLMRCSTQEGDLVNLFREADDAAKEEILKFIQFRLMRMQKDLPDNLVKMPVNR